MWTSIPLRITVNLYRAETGLEALELGFTKDLSGLSALDIFLQSPSTRTATEITISFLALKIHQQITATSLRLSLENFGLLVPKLWAEAQRKTEDKIPWLPRMSGKHFCQSNSVQLQWKTRRSTDLTSLKHIGHKGDIEHFLMKKFSLTANRYPPPEMLHFMGDFEIPNKFPWPRILDLFLILSRWSLK